MHMAGGDAQGGGGGDARASCASPLGTPLPVPFLYSLKYHKVSCKISFFFLHRFAHDHYLVFGALSYILISCNPLNGDILTVCSRS
jgi:hypothetical protein